MRWGMRRQSASTGGAADLASHRMEQTIGALTAECRGLALRLERVEQRLDDAEDAIALALSPDRVDDLERRVADFTLDLPTQDDLLDVRLHSARVAAEITRVTTELRAEIEQAVADRLHLVVGEPVVVEPTTEDAQANDAHHDGERELVIDLDADPEDRGRTATG